MKKFYLAINLVHAERKRQQEKWGNQNHDVSTWMLILGEEFGEAAQAALHDIFGGPKAGTFQTEVIHVAAVAVQMIEWLLRDEALAFSPKSPYAREHIVPDYSEGERCFCGVYASHKVEEVLKSEAVHPFTAYVCCEHFAALMGPAAADSCGVEYVKNPPPIG